MRNVLGLDHVVLLVRDLGDAETRLTRLGFRPTPRGLHSAHMGTANTTVVFGDRTYIEALAEIQPTPANQAIRAELAAREGPWGLAFKSDDASAAAGEFAAAGIGDGSVTEFARPVDLPSGTEEAAFRVAPTDASRTPGAWLFVCQHRTPEVTWRADYLEQPNGVTGVAEVIGVAEDLAVVEAAYRPVFGDRLTRESAQVVIAAGSAQICFVRPPTFEQRFTPLQPSAGDQPRLLALRFRSTSLARTESLLATQGVPVSRTTDGGLLVAPEHACGTLIEFAVD